MLYPYRELTITSKVQECCGWEFAAKLGEPDYSFILGLPMVKNLGELFAISSDTHYLKGRGMSLFVLETPHRVFIH